MAAEMRVYCDGAVRGNSDPERPNRASIGYWVWYNGHQTTCGSRFIGDATSNEAEYQAVISGLVEVQEYDVDRVTVLTDSQLVVGQVTGEWDCNERHLRELRDRTRELADSFTQFEIRWLEGSRNQTADELAREALEDHPSVTPR